MNNPQIWWKEKVLSPQLCDLIIQEANWEQELEAGFVYDNQQKLDHVKRKTKIVFEEVDSVAGCILQTYIQTANFKANWNFNISYLQKVQIGKYEDKGHYDWHIDTMKPDEFGMQRKLSSVLFLSHPEDYEGGVFELNNLEKPLEKLPKGSIIVFPSYISHRVTPVTKGTRYTATSWMMGPTFK
jgi:PKHD-type hydroxylase